MKVFYLIGVPGAGKTTLMRAITAGLPERQHRGTVPHIDYSNGRAAQIGRDRGPSGFGGTDALSMSIQPKVLSWLASEPYPIVMAEGDRLGNAKFFGALRAEGVDLTVAYLHMEPHVAAQRRDQRGSDQNEAWLKGRITKVAGLKEQYVTVTLDGTLHPSELAQQCRALPVFKGLF